MAFELDVPSRLMAALGPDILLVVGAMVLALWAAWRPDSPAHQRRIALGALVVCGLTMAAVLWYLTGSAVAGPGIIAVDNFRWVTDLVVLLATVLTIALAIDYGERRGLVAAESYVLLLLATSGMMLLAAARDLMLVFLGIELMSVAVYVLTGLERRSARAAEAALKYFLLGAFSTAFLLYGIALVYGATGSTNLSVIGTRIVGGAVLSTPMLLVGTALLVVGFGFKVAAVPFHMWTPDVYEGAPTPITAYMAAAVKAAAFAAFFRVWLEAFPGTSGAWTAALFWLAIITMVVGNVTALAQRNLKRLLAYSSIAHAGYLLVALVAGTGDGGSAFLFYLVAYTLATMGAFGVVTVLGREGGGGEAVSDYAGLWRERPWLATAMAVFMLALLGFPIVGGMGFFAKWYILRAAIQAPRPQIALAVVLVLTSVVSAGYYLGVVMVMFMRPRPVGNEAVPRVGTLAGAVIGASAVLLLFFGIFPDSLVRLARESAPEVLARRGVAMMDAPGGGGSAASRGAPTAIRFRATSQPAGSGH